MIDCTPGSLAYEARCFSCVPKGSIAAVKTYLIATWGNCGVVIPPLTGPVIVDDGTGHFWELIVDNNGNLGAEDNAGPATPDVVLDDGMGGFWIIIVSPTGLVGSAAAVPPSTTPPVLASPNGDHWTIIVDQFGNVGTQM